MINVDEAQTLVLNEKITHGYRFVSIVDAIGEIIAEDVISKVFAYTPVPGGVGPMTVTMLLVNTIFSWQKQFGLSSTLNDLLP